MDYQFIARSRGQQPVLYAERRGKENWWILVSRDAANYYFYTGTLGMEFAGVYTADGFKAKLVQDKDYFTNYPSRLVLTLEQMHGYCHVGHAGKDCLPDEVQRDPRLLQLWGDIRLGVKRHEKFPVELCDIQEARDVELRQWALEQYGWERYVRESGQVRDQEGESLLLEHNGDMYLAVKDASTPRRYVLCVPPDLLTVREAIAWTFCMTEEEYDPLVET